MYLLNTRCHNPKNGNLEIHRRGKITSHKPNYFYRLYDIITSVIRLFNNEWGKRIIIYSELEWTGKGSDHRQFDDSKVPEITQKNNERFSAA
jgi:hypothetical protein